METASKAISLALHGNCFLHFRAEHHLLSEAGEAYMIFLKSGERKEKPIE